MAAALVIGCHETPLMPHPAGGSGGGVASAGGHGGGSGGGIGSGDGGCPGGSGDYFDAGPPPEIHPDSGICCPVVLPQDAGVYPPPGCASVGGYNVLHGGNCPVVCDLSCATNWRYGMEGSTCTVLLYDIRQPGPGENALCMPVDAGLGVRDAVQEASDPGN